MKSNALKNKPFIKL